MQLSGLSRLTMILTIASFGMPELIETAISGIMTPIRIGKLRDTSKIAAQDINRSIPDIVSLEMQIK